MKLDTSGLESTAPLFGAGSELLDESSVAPSFEIPNALDVSCNMLYFRMILIIIIINNHFPSISV